MAAQMLRQALGIAIQSQKSKSRSQQRRSERTKRVPDVPAFGWVCPQQWNDQEHAARNHQLFVYLFWDKVVKVLQGFLRQCEDNFFPMVFESFHESQRLMIRHQAEERAEKRWKQKFEVRLCGGMIRSPERTRKEQKPKWMENSG